MRAAPVNRLRRNARISAAPDAGPARLRHRAETQAAPLPPLLIAAERVAATVAQGVHGRRRVGQGESFWQYRPYEIGDAPQAVDWRASAKSDRIYVRQNEWEAAQTLYLWCDSSASMDYASARDLPTKAEAGVILGLALASLLVRAGERVAPLAGGARPMTGRPALESLARALSAGLASPSADSARTPNAGDSLPPLEPLPRHARAVLISDFLSPVADIADIIRAYSARGVTGHLMRIADPAEDSLPFHGRVRFSGFEGEGDWLIGRVESVRSAYEDLMRSRDSALAAAATTAGWSFACHRTDKAPSVSLMALYRVLSDRPDR